MSIREWMNEGSGRWVTLVGSLVLLAVAVTVWILRSSGSEQRIKAIQDAGKAVPIYCRACKHTEELRLPWNPPMPMACPKCQAVEAVPAFRCVGCRQLIERKHVPVYRCRCGQVYDNRVGGGGGGELPEGGTPPDAPAD